MFGTVISFLAKIGIGTIAERIASAYEAREHAKTDHARLEAQERIKVLEARRDVLIAEKATALNAVIRATFALPVAIYFGKLFLWDKVLGLGATDPLSPLMQQIALVVVGFYFVTEGASTVVRLCKKL